MSTTGRVRLAMSGVRTAGAIGVGLALVWGGWQVASALRANSSAMPVAAKGVPVTKFVLETATGGVLDEAWLRRSLALPKGTSLMQLDLPRLKAKLESDGQVISAHLTRRFPDTLAVQVSERSPVARLKVRVGASDQDFLVARDGVVYEGSNYDSGMLNTLPWLAGFSLKPEGAGFQPIPRMHHVADLLARAQFEATHLYLNWQIVSLERLEKDREIEVTTKDGARIVFSTKADFFPQLAKLDNIVERLRDAARFPTARTARAHIDLSLGREVPVMLEAAAPRLLAPVAAPPPALSPGFNVFSPSQPKSTREL
jgi:cell division protein FtsQ